MMHGPINLILLCYFCIIVVVKSWYFKVFFKTIPTYLQGFFVTFFSLQISSVLPHNIGLDSVKKKVNNSISNSKSLILTTHDKSQNECSVKYSTESAVKGDRSDITGQKVECVSVSTSSTCTTVTQLSSDSLAH